MRFDDCDDYCVCKKGTKHQRDSWNNGYRCVRFIKWGGHMKRAFGAIFLSALIAVSVSSAEQNIAFADDRATTLDTVKERLSNPQPPADIKPVVSMASSIATANGQNKPKADRQTPSVSIALPDYVFKDGAFYMVLAGSNVLIPMSGGGASGCFTKDLDQRENKLKDYTKKLPRKVSF